MHGHRDILERWFAAFNAHDLDGLYALADPEVEIRPVGNTLTAAAGAIYHGHDGITSLIAPGFERWAKLRLEPEHVDEVGDAVLASLSLVLDDGATADPPVRSGAVVYRFRDGRLLLIHSFNTAEEALATVQAREPRLTPREREVFQLLAEGLTAPQIADRLFLSPATVRTHVQNGIDRLGVSTRVQAVARALAHGEIEVE
jgi:DNA-binding CsgD family transcriptional regulator